ncbi:MAG: hypothetical protein HRT82_15835 [Henriciella sp.]|nr:hypothetical protein [Henriciella sp.]
MALADDLVPDNKREPLPRGPIVDIRRGTLTIPFRNHLETNRNQIGEVISGVERNAANIVQLETDYTAADGALTTAYIAADAVVASDAAAARATLSTTLTAAYQAADAVIQADLDTAEASLVTAEANITTLQSTTASNTSAIAANTSEITAARDGEVSLTAKISAVETAYAAADSAEATARETLEASLQRANLLPPEYQLWGEAEATGDLLLLLDNAQVINTTVTNPYLERDAARFRGTGSATHIRISLAAAAGSTNMTLPPRRYAYKVAFRVNANLSDGQLKVEVRNGSDTVVATDTASTFKTEGGDDSSWGVNVTRVAEGVLDLSSATESDYYLSLEFEKTVAATLGTTHSVFVFRSQLEAILDSVSGPGDWSSTASADALVTAIATEGAARATAIDTLTAELRGGVNLLSYARFDDVATAGSSSVDPLGWDGRPNIGGMSGASVGVTGSSVGASNQPPGVRCIRFRQPASTPSGYSDILYNGRNGDYMEIPCIPGQRYCASVYVNAQNGSEMRVVLNFRDSSGSYISLGDNQDNTNYSGSTSLGAAGTLSPDDMERIWAFADAPSTAAYVIMGVQKYPHASNQSFGFATLPMIEEATDSQENPSPWSDGIRTADATVLRSAFVDSDGNAYAGIRLVAAASGGTPAIVELTSGDGGSSVRLGGDTEIDGDLVVNGTITSDGIAANAISEFSGNEVASAVTLVKDTWVTVATENVTTNGGRVIINASAYASASSTAVLFANCRIRRGSTTIFESGALPNIDDGSGGNYCAGIVPVTAIDEPSAGTYDYDFDIYVDVQGASPLTGTPEATDRVIYVQEFKK